MSQTVLEREEHAIHFADVSEAFQFEERFEAIEAQPIERVRLLWNRRRTIYRVTMIGFFVSVIAAFAIPKRYTATTQLMPPDPQSASSAMMLAGLASKAGTGLGAIAGDLLGLKSSGALFVGMLESQSIQDRLVERFKLQKIYGKKLVADARKELNANTGIQEDRRSGIISIAVTDKNAQRAADLANSYVQELNSMVAKLSTSSAHREREFLEGRLESVKGELEDAEQQLAQFSSKNKTIDMQQQGKAMLEAAATLSGELIAAQSELEGLRQIYTDENARVREASARVGELKRDLDKLGGAGEPNAKAAGTSTGLIVAKPNADAAPVDGATGLPYPSLRELPLLGAKYADYFRRAKIEETVYELLTEQYELAKVEEAKETPSVKVLDPAEVPERKSFPPRLAIVIFGTALALGAAAAGIVGNARWNAIEAGDERKIFVEEVAAAARARIAELTNWVSETRARRRDDTFKNAENEAPSRDARENDERDS